MTTLKMDIRIAQMKSDDKDVTMNAIEDYEYSLLTLLHNRYEDIEDLQNMLHALKRVEKIVIDQMTDVYQDEVVNLQSDRKENISLYTKKVIDERLMHIQSQAWLRDEND